MKSFFLLVALVTSTIVFAQDYLDLVNLQYTNYADVPNGENADETTDYASLAAELLLPIKLNEEYAVITGVDYYSKNLDLTTANLMGVPTRFTNQNLQFIRGKIGFSYDPEGKKHDFKLIAIPKLSSDFKNISSSDMQMGFLGLYDYDKSENFSLKFGLYATTEAFGFMITPLVGLYYRSSDRRWEINALLPNLMNLEYSISETFGLGFNASNLVNSYNLNDNDTSPYYVQTDPLEFKAYGVARFMDKKLLLNLAVSYFGSDYLLYEKSGDGVLQLGPITLNDDRTQLNSEFDGGIGFNLGLKYRFYLSDKERRFTPD